MNRHPPHCLHTEVVSQFGLLTGAHVYKDINASNAPSLKIPRCSQQIIRLLFLRAPRYYASLAMVYVRSNVRSIGIHPDRLVGQSLVTSPPFSLVIGTRPSVRGRLSMVSISTLPPRREFPFYSSYRRRRVCPARWKTGLYRQLERNRGKASREG